jgi:hypothetical protein
VPSCSPRRPGVVVRHLAVLCTDCVSEHWRTQPAEPCEMCGRPVVEAWVAKRHRMLSSERCLKQAASLSHRQRWRAATASASTRSVSGVEWPRRVKYGLRCATAEATGDQAGGGEAGACQIGLPAAPLTARRLRLALAWPPSAPDGPGCRRQRRGTPRSRPCPDLGTGFYGSRPRF